MPLLNTLSNLINKAGDKLEDRVHRQAQAGQGQGHAQQYQPPNIPQHDGAGRQQPIGPPGDQSRPQRVAYWHPVLYGNVSQHFRHELGAHGWGNNEAQNYVADSRNSFVTASSSFAPDPESNKLHLVAIANSKHADPGQRYTSARLTSIVTLARDRGVLSARITAPIAKGVWPAFWMLPEDPFRWPEDGEVDIFEAWDGSSVCHSCLHWGHFDGNDWNKHRVVETELGPNIRAGHGGPGARPGGGSEGKQHLVDKLLHTVEHAADKLHEKQYKQDSGAHPTADTRSEGVLFEFAWIDQPNGDGKMVWYIDGRPVMKASRPRGTRPLRDYRLIINIAMGGNVCKGRLPADGAYEMVIRDLAMWESRDGGWDGFERDFLQTKEGHTS